MTYDERSFHRLMKRNGYTRQTGRGKGSHVIYKNGSRTISIGDKYNRMVIQRLIKEYDLFTD